MFHKCVITLKTITGGEKHTISLFFEGLYASWIPRLPFLEELSSQKNACNPILSIYEHSTPNPRSPLTDLTYSQVDYNQLKSLTRFLRILISFSN